MSVLNLIQNYYGGIIGSLVSVGSIAKLATQSFKKYVITNMLVLQKDVNLTDEQKFEKLTSDIYNNNLPAIVKVLISQKRFSQLSQAIYDAIFPPKVTPNTTVDSNDELKLALSSMLSDVIETLDKNTNDKIEQAMTEIENAKKAELNKIAENLKQTLGVKDNNQPVQ